MEKITDIKEKMLTKRQIEQLSDNLQMCCGQNVEDVMSFYYEAHYHLYVLGQTLADDEPEHELVDRCMNLLYKVGSNYRELLKAAEDYNRAIELGY